MFKKIVLLIITFYACSVLSYSESSDEIAQSLFDEGKELQLMEEHGQAVDKFDQVLSLLAEKEDDISQENLWQFRLLVEYESAYSQVVLGEYTFIESLLQRDENLLDEYRYHYSYDVSDLAQNIRLALYKAPTAYARATDKERLYVFRDYYTALYRIYEKLDLYDLEVLNETFSTIDLYDYLIDLNAMYPYYSQIEDDAVQQYLKVIQGVHQLQGEGKFMAANELIDRLSRPTGVFNYYKYGEDVQLVNTYEKAYNDMMLGEYWTLEKLIEGDQTLLGNASLIWNNKGKHASWARASLFKATLSYALERGITDPDYESYLDALQTAYSDMAAVKNYETTEISGDREEILRYLDKVYPHNFDLKRQLSIYYGSIKEYQSMDSFMNETFDRYSDYFENDLIIESFASGLLKYYIEWFEEEYVKGNLTLASEIYNKTSPLYSDYGSYSINNYTTAYMRMPFQLGQAYYNDGKDTQALEYYQVFMASIFTSEEKFDEKITSLNYKKYFSNDEMVNGLIHYCILMDGSDDKETFEQAVKKLNEFYDRYPTETYKSAKIFFEQGKLDDAVDLFKKVLEERPYHKNAAIYIRQKSVLDGDVKTAIAQYNKPEDNTLLSNLEDSGQRFLYEVDGNYNMSQSLMIDEIHRKVSERFIEIPRVFFSVGVPLGNFLLLLMLVMALVLGTRNKPLTYSMVTKTFYGEMSLLKATLHDVEVSSDLHTEMEVE